jgi:hypothetical protein
MHAAEDPDMTYSPTHNAFLITQDDLKRASIELKYCIRRARQMAGVPLGKRKMEGLEDIDHLEKGIIDAARDVGIDFGVHWGAELDVSDKDGA